MDCIEFTEKLLKSKGIAVTPGIPFGDGNKNYIRISYATSIQNLQKAIEKIKEFLEEQNLI